MTTGPFDDELLNAVIDGTADDATVAAVQADPVASARLAGLRRVAELVGATPPPASPERRASSIAAAMAAAQSSAPEGISSLAAARHAREEAAASRRRREIPRGWLAAAAAVLVVALGIPILNSLGGDDADTFATSASDTADDASFSADDSDDSADGGSDGGAMADEAMAETDAMEDDGAMDMAEEAEAAADLGADDSGDAATDDAATAPTTTTIASEQRATLAEFDITPLTIPLGQIPLDIESGLIEPTYSFDDEVLFEFVPAECLADLANSGTTEFDLVIRTPDDLLTLIGFSVDGSFLILDAETCDQLG